MSKGLIGGMIGGIQSTIIRLTGKFIIVLIFLLISHRVGRNYPVYAQLRMPVFWLTIGWFLYSTLVSGAIAVKTHSNRTKMAAGQGQKRG
nr:hypothetical protein [uncultured Desulfobacter sp.]